MRTTILLLCALLAGCDKVPNVPETSESIPHLAPYVEYKVSGIYFVEFHTTRGDFCVAAYNAGIACDWSADDD